MTTQRPTELANNTFTTSSPETRNGLGQPDGTWRCAHADVLDDVLRRHVGEHFYADHMGDSSTGARRIWVGNRRNDRAEHRDEIARCAAWLRCQGFKVRNNRTHIVVTDHAPIARA